MTNKEKIECLSAKTRKLDMLVTSVKDMENYPMSFFNQSFGLVREILNLLHLTESEQVELLREQLAEHESIIKKTQEIQRVESLVVEVEDENEKENEKEEEVQVIQQVEASVIEEEKEEVQEVEAPVMKKEEEIVPQQKPEERQNISLNEVLERKKMSDFRKAFSLNDCFFFRRELFGGDEERMNNTIANIDKLDSYEASLDYINSEFEWDMANPVVSDFMKRIEKRFH